MVATEFTLLGDAIWLDFVNSARGRVPSPPDLLPNAAAYQRWAHIQHLEMEPDPGAFSRAREFRAWLTTLAEALGAGQQPPGGVIEAINQQLARSPGIHQLTRVSGEWRLRFAPSRPLTALDAIAQSAARTLTDPLVTVRRCASQTCSVFFTDGSPTRSRRWCDPSICGRHTRVERRRGSLR
jgi:predicted RNA-binding Zn ribbon-like protein